MGVLIFCGSIFQIIISGLYNAVNPGERLILEYGICSRSFRRFVTDRTAVLGPGGFIYACPICAFRQHNWGSTEK